MSSVTREINWKNTTTSTTNDFPLLEKMRQCDKRGGSYLYQMQAVDTNVRIIDIQRGIDHEHAYKSA